MRGSPGYDLTESAPRPSTGGTVGPFTFSTLPGNAELLS
jgi:hypothetical protein